MASQYAGWEIKGDGYFGMGSGPMRAVAAREPLVAFNVELAASHTLEEARAIAGRIREGGPEGLPGVRALGVQPARAAQVSTNVEDHRAAPPGPIMPRPIMPGPMPGPIMP